MTDSPIIRLVTAMRAEGYTDDVAIGCAVMRVYPWVKVPTLVAALMVETHSPLPVGWHRGMFAGKPAMDAIKAAVASIRRRDLDRSTR